MDSTGTPPRNDRRARRIDAASGHPRYSVVAHATSTPRDAPLAADRRFYGASSDAHEVAAGATLIAPPRGMH